MTDDAARRSALEEERGQLLRRVDELTVGGEVDLDFDSEHADRGSVAAEQGENRSLADSLKYHLTQVEAALAKMDDGTYGTCEVCGNRIGEDRLDAMPATQRCIEHA